MNKSVRYWSRDEIENIVKDKNIDRTRFHEFSKFEYEKVIKKFYYSFCDYSVCKEISSLSYVWLKFRRNLIKTATVSENVGWNNMLNAITEEMEYNWNKKLYLILSDGWVYEGYIDEIITVLGETTGNVEDFYIVSLDFDCMVAYCDDGGCLVFYRNSETIKF